MARPISIVEITAEERTELERTVSAHTTPQRDTVRAAIILKRGTGRKQVDVAAELDVSVACVNKRSQRFEGEGIERLKDRQRSGRPNEIPVEIVERVITQATRPVEPRSRWSVRTMAANVGISPDCVHRIWRENDLKLHLHRTFKVSTDKGFEREFWDVSGLYLNPPERALVLCCDEKSQCQALERTQPGLPLGVGHIARATHDYRCHGTITLFAALSYLDGKLISRTAERHTHVEWLRFLKQIDRGTRKELEVHLILDNYATHKHETVFKWLKRHPRFNLHFTATSSSWMNLVEWSFGELTSEVIRDGSLTAVRHLARDITDYIAQRNLNPKPDVWNAKGQEILRKSESVRQVLTRAQTEQG